MIDIDALLQLTCVCVAVLLAMAYGYNCGKRSK